MTSYEGYDATAFAREIYERTLPGEVTTAVVTGSGEIYDGPCKVYWASFYTKAQVPAEGDLRDGGSSSTQRFRWSVVGFQNGNYDHRHALMNPPVQYNTNLYATLPSNTVLTVGYVPD